MRLNLVGSGLCSQKTGNFFAVYLPWALSWTLYFGESVKELLSWGGLLFISLVVFLFPLMIALHNVIQSDVTGSVDVWLGLVKSRRGERIALSCLLVFATLSVVFAIFGQLASEFQ